MIRMRLVTLLIVVFVASCSARKQLVGRGAVPGVEKAREVNMVLNSLENQQLKIFTDEWLGVRYRYGGTDKNGVDCSGLAGALYKLVYGKALPRSSYEMAYTSTMTQDAPAEGDLLFFAFNSNKVNHVGIYLGNNYFIHASTTRGVVIDNLSMPEFTRAYKGLLKKI